MGDLTDLRVKGGRERFGWGLRESGKTKGEESAWVEEKGREKKN